MTNLVRLVVFRIEERRFALPLASVDRVFHAVEVTPLPGAPPIAMGAINAEGRVLPVLNLRKRLGLPDREITLADHFLVARAHDRVIVLVVDETEGVIERRPSEVTASTDLAPGLNGFEGIVLLDGGLVLIQDLNRLLSLEEAEALEDVAFSKP